MKRCPVSVGGICLEKKTGWPACRDGDCLWQVFAPAGWLLDGKACLANCHEVICRALGECSWPGREDAAANTGNGGGEV